MKINPIGLNSINPYKKQQRNIKTGQSFSTFNDTLEISSAAKEMQVQSSYNLERNEKVKKIKEQIESGEYKVNARQVAEKMLQYYRF